MSRCTELREIEDIAGVEKHFANFEYSWLAGAEVYLVCKS